MADSSAVKHAPLRWHGSKWRIAPWVISHFPKHFTYVEPFCGSASVLLRKPRSPSEIINDQDDLLINFFTVARTQPDELVRAVGMTPFSRNEYLNCWKALRDTEIDPLDRARALVVVSMQARGSIVGRSSPTGWRIFALKSTFGSTPAQQWLNIPSRIEDMIYRLRGVNIECGDALKVIYAQDSAESLFYCDPPYMESSLTGGKYNYKHAYTVDDHAKLANTLHRIKGMAVLSGYDTPQYADMYPNWRRYQVKAKAEMNIERTECLWINPAAQERLDAEEETRVVRLTGT